MDTGRNFGAKSNALPPSPSASHSSPSPPESSPPMAQFSTGAGHWASGPGPWSSSARYSCRWSSRPSHRASPWLATRTSGHHAWQTPRSAGSSAGFRSSSLSSTSPRSTTPWPPQSCRRSWAILPPCQTSGWVRP